MIKILSGGIEMLVEDWPGRLGYMGLGMAAAGAADNLALQLGNLLVGNKAGEAGIEIAGGYCKVEFEKDMVIALTGADMEPTLNGEAFPMWETVAVKKGDVIALSHFGASGGFRDYLCVEGGIDVPEYLGSKSTCLFGNYGGFEGRKLAEGDELKTGEPTGAVAGKKINPKYIPEYTHVWELRTIPGPNSAPDYVTPEGMDYLYSAEFKISHNANRAAHRLSEVPANFWAREDGGKGGSHPSNIVDHGYNIRGGINVTGNTPSLLIADGPTLGGFVCVGQVINADLWKIGQGIPSMDKIKFILTTSDEAIKAREEREAMLAADDLLV